MNDRRSGDAKAPSSEELDAAFKASGSEASLPASLTSRQRQYSSSSLSSSLNSVDTSPSNTPELKARTGTTTPTWRSRIASSSFDNIPLLQLLNPNNVTLEMKNKNTYQWVKNYGKRLNDKRRKKIHFRMSKEERANMKKVFDERFDKAYQRLDKITKDSKTEKIFFPMSLYIIFLSGLVIGKHPDWFHVLYTILFCCLMPVRFITYLKVGWGFYLADLCYYVNVLLMAYIWLFPDSKFLFVACCSFSWGTLSFAVITWRNKLVLHSIEKTTSTFIHVLPGTVMYVITHELPYEYKEVRFPGSVKLEHWEFAHGILYTSALYFVWQLGYHYFITIRKADQIKNGQVTSFEYLRKAFATKPIGKFVNSLPEPFPVVAFTFLQYGYQLVTMSLCPLFFNYKYASAVFTSMIFLVACYNGATYYVDYYGKTFQKEVVRLQQELDKLQSKVESADDLPKTAESEGTIVEEAMQTENPADALETADVLKTEKELDGVKSGILKTEGALKTESSKA